jgi:hypothetical protein
MCHFAQSSTALNAHRQNGNSEFHLMDYEDHDGFYEGGETALVIGNERTLRREILKRSVSQVWEVALSEWHIAGISHGRAICLCGHDPIHEIFHIKNTENGECGLIGNVCITKFMGRDVSGFVDCFNRIRIDATKGLNKATAEFCLGRRLINELEYDFALPTLGKRSLSSADINLRRYINGRILKGLPNAPVYDPSILAQIIAKKAEAAAKAARAVELEMAARAATVPSLKKLPEPQELPSWKSGTLGRRQEPQRLRNKMLTGLRDKRLGTLMPRRGLQGLKLTGLLDKNCTMIGSPSKGRSMRKRPTTG